MARSMHANSRPQRKSYGKRMCNMVAYALLVHTLMLIFVTAPSLGFGEMSITPYLLLVVLVALAIPFLRNVEKKWRHVTDADMSLRRSFIEDSIALWAFAIAMPVVYRLPAVFLARLLA